MIELTRSQTSPTPGVKILGLGSAGGNIVDRLILDGFDANDTAALNTDLQALNGCVAVEKVHLGKATTRGLGAGGDPELGYAAAEEAVDEIQAVIGRASMVFLCVGLGGGTGSGAAPMVAHLARKSGALVVALVTMPFGFEGKRRSAQAAEALDQLEQQANVVLCFENDAMGSIVSPTAPIQEAFVSSDHTLSQAIRALIGMVQRRGLVNVGLDDLIAAVGRPRSGSGVRCLFGAGESDSANRAHEAIERALRCPLMDRGRMLADAHQVLVHVAGGNELTLNEVTILMEEFNRHISESTRVNFGVAVDPRLGRRIAVSILCSTAPVVQQPVKSTRSTAAVPVAPLVEKKSKAKREVEPEAPVAEFAEEEEEQEAEPTLLPEIMSTPAVTPAAKKYAPGPAVAASATKPQTPPAKKEEKAEQMTLEPVNRGRFEKSEPTIVDGEDLDVPTFLRKNVRR